MTVKICYTYKPDGTLESGVWGEPNTVTFKVIEGDYQPSVVCPFNPQIMYGDGQIRQALAATDPNPDPTHVTDGFHAGQLLYLAALNAFQPDQWPTGLLAWVPEENEMQIQVDGVKVATFDLDTGDVTPVEQPTN